jgi:hypothetical protein
VSASYRDGLPDLTNLTGHQLCSAFTRQTAQALLPGVGTALSLDHPIACIYDVDLGVQTGLLSTKSVELVAIELHGSPLHVARPTAQLAVSKPPADETDAHLVTANGPGTDAAGVFSHHVNGGSVQSVIWQQGTYLLTLVYENSGPAGSAADVSSQLDAAAMSIAQRL